MKKKILIVIGTYLPGYKAGGPVRSIENLVDRLGDEYDFRVLTSACDLNSNEPYDGIVPYTWTKQGNAMVYYVEPGKFTLKNLLIALDGVDSVYVCGCFNDYARTVLRAKKRNLIKCPVTLAAMGLFGEGAMRIKYAKKRVYLQLLKGFKYFENIRWSASSEVEVSEIKKQIGDGAKCYIARDLPISFDSNVIESRCLVNDSTEVLKVTFYSRISPKKNLSYALDVLKRVKANIRFTIIGPCEDIGYWKECQDKIDALHGNIKTVYCGAIEGNKVIDTLKSQDVLLFPTLSENFGHAIYEAMASGVIPVLSDNTIWTEDILDNNLGCVFSLNEMCQFADAIDEFASMSKETINSYRKRICEYLLKYDETINLEGYRRIFDYSE